MNAPRNRQDLIKDALSVLQPTSLTLQDNSAQHAGHVGAKDGGGHFTLHIVSPLFAGKSTLQRHQMTYKALGNLMQTEIHAISIKASAP